jgi:hypothetical protein
VRLNSSICVKSIVEPNKVLAVVSGNLPDSRVNLTPKDQILQVSFLNFGRNEQVHPHSHLKLERNTVGTQEVWVVLKGKAVASFYDTDNSYLNSIKISKGQVIILFEGGHALKTKSRNFLMVEIKNGPYLGKRYDTVQIS